MRLAYPTWKGKFLSLYCCHSVKEGWKGCQQSSSMFTDYFLEDKTFFLSLSLTADFLVPIRVTACICHSKMIVVWTSVTVTRWLHISGNYIAADFISHKLLNGLPIKITFFMLLTFEPIKAHFLLHVHRLFSHHRLRRTFQLIRVHESSTYLAFANFQKLEWFSSPENKLSPWRLPRSDFSDSSHWIPAKPQHFGTLFYLLKYSWVCFRLSCLLNNKPWDVRLFWTIYALGRIQNTVDTGKILMFEWHRNGWDKR